VSRFVNRFPGTERARLTALYGGLLVLAGVLLTGLVYLLVRQGLYASISTAVTSSVPAQRAADEPSPLSPATPDAQVWPVSPVEPPSHVGAIKVATKTVSDAAEDAVLNRLLMVSVIVLAAYAVLSVALAWWMAGRVLRPVAVITETARSLSGRNLHERIALEGPPGELKGLADTFDEMLGRMEQLVGAQQRFAANAAHELRTPVAVQRAAAEIGLAGEPDAERVARIRTKLLGVADDSERLIEGLLLLAASDQGLERHDPVRLDEVVSSATTALAAEAEAHGVTATVRTHPLTVRGDAILLDHLVHNLVANAIRHNVRGGRVDVRCGQTGIEVSNTGPVVPAETVPLLFEPFRRLSERRHAPGEGAGLGLSIVASIARAHEGEATAKPNEGGGGLTIRVSFPTGDGA
jgi:signal transduction histidine kinase